MQIKNKIFAMLLIFAFIMSVSCIAAADTQDIAENLEIADGESDIVAVADESEDTAQNSETPLGASAADENETTLGASAAGEDEPNVASSPSKADVKIEVLDKNPKVGDKVRVKITASNLGPNDANDVRVGFSFTDLDANIDTSLKFLDDGTYDVKTADGGYEVNFGFLSAGESRSIILTFLATESGEKVVVASMYSDDFEEDVYDQDTFTVKEASSPASAAKDKNKISLELPTGNPLALLALALLCMVPCYRRR